ncbi:protein distal antenna-like [Prorops nasuta]|uniref:protein distal antenna-like n=1 Tax=Prorops nasuta TaxID=863751 RepID=UPI0034CED7D8
MRGESARPGKRPLRALSASEKMDAIQRVHEGQSKAAVARDIGVPESTLRGWCKSEHKIRGMARNSSTPDSEAHSPASSSGANNLVTNVASGSANLSSEDEGPCSKKVKLDTSIGASSSPYVTADSDADLKDKLKIDYVGLMNSMASMRPENSSLLLQQLGLLSGATAANALAKNLLSMSPVLTTHASTVGLVENGLQYTKSSASGNSTNSLQHHHHHHHHQQQQQQQNNSSSSKRHGISVIAPAQMDSVVAKSCGSRKSLPPAAEAPSTPVPASPRKTNENCGSGGGSGSLQRSSSSSAKSKKDGSGGSAGGGGGSATTNKKADEALWLWLTQQQQLLGQHSATFNPSINQQDGSWFWQWYKQCSFPLLASAPLTSTPVAKKSPSKARALLDNVLCNNNNENVKRILHDEEEEEETLEAPITTEEAIEHGEKFFKWLDKCSEPAVTRLQIIQFKYLLDNLKTCRKKSSSLKQSRK